MRVTDRESRLGIFLAVEAAAEVGAVDPRLDGDLGAGTVVLAWPPVGVLVVEPVPGALDSGRGADRQSPLGCGAVTDRLVEVSNDDDSDAVGPPGRQWRAAGRLQGDAGLIVGVSVVNVPVREARCPPPRAVAVTV